MSTTASKLASIDAGDDLLEPTSSPPTRRRILQFVAVAGIGNAVFGRALVAIAGDSPVITAKMIERASWIAGIDLTPAERDQMIEGMGSLREAFDINRRVDLANDVPPAIGFQPLLDRNRPRDRPNRLQAAEAVSARRGSDEDLAFAPVAHLASLLRRREISSVELTRLYLERLERYDPLLECVISLTPDRALQQAELADREIAAGRYRGPLHGVPWGAKDLFSVAGYPTTWGAEPYRRQMIDDTATVVERLEAAGAVLTAKLSLGALAFGDQWFDGKTRNPWNPTDGSSGSSAGSASATAAGLVGFALGTETWGSIVSPCTRCGVTGLRPTFGRVSRHGAMALSWSMDKVGPIARSVEDCALVFHAIEGADARDPHASDGPFEWPLFRDPRTLRIGFVEKHFMEDRTKELVDPDPVEIKRARAWKAFDLATLESLREIGFDLRPISLPSRHPVASLSLILRAEAACAFDRLTRSGRDELLVRQGDRAWPNIFRQAQLIPAVEYLRANRIRTLVMREMEERLEEVDVYVTPTYGGDHLLMTNLTGHPCVVVPNGFSSDGLPTSITFMGRLDGESEVLAVAHAYQQATDFHQRRPVLEPSRAQANP